MGEWQQGYAKAITDCVAIAERWRDENKASRDRARIKGAKRSRLDGDETHLIMAEQLDGAAIECNAIAQEMRKLAPSEVVPEHG